MGKKKAAAKTSSAKPRPRRIRKTVRPYVAVTFAMTVDGKITTKNLSAIDFTSRDDKSHLIRQRAMGDAVLIGHSTLKKDNVRLGIGRPELRAERLARGQSEYPLRVIISNEGRIDPALNIFQTDFAPIIIFSTVRMPVKVQKKLREKAILHLGETSAVDLRWMLLQLRREYGVKRIACEGGAALFRSLLKLKLVDQLNLTLAPLLFGGANAPTLTGTGFGFFPRTIRCSLQEMKVIGDECFLTYTFNWSPTVKSKKSKRQNIQPKRRTRA